MIETITSRKNPLMQQVRKLLTSRKERESTGLFVSDGTKLLQEAIRWWPGLDTVILSQDVDMEILQGVRVVKVPADVMESISPMASPQGALFLCRLPEKTGFVPKKGNFEEMTVAKQSAVLATQLDHIWVYDDGVVKGFIQIEKQEVKKLFVEPIIQGQTIGARLLEYAISKMNANHLWALEKNVRAIAFYKRHGFNVTSVKKLEDDTTEYLVRMER